MTHQQELELLAEWLGVRVDKLESGLFIPSGKYMQREWNPSPEGNDTDFLNMVAGRVDIESHDTYIVAITPDTSFIKVEEYADHNNDQVQAMKHAAYQVCLRAAREVKE